MQLMKGLPEREAQAVAWLLLERVCQLSRTDVLMGKADTLPTAKRQELEQMARRVAAGEPVQYVTGVEDFCGLQIHVEPGVLIPRPETEVLVTRTIERMEQATHPRILDIGTGSGCMALALKQRFGDGQVEAWDVSTEALRIATDNARRLQLDIDFRCRDILQPDDNNPDDRYTLIISNPPYVCRSEAAEMEANVLEHEPHTALFVPDDDPLRFYRAIATFATQHLTTGGRLHFEINRRFGNDIVCLLQSLGFSDVELECDPFDQPRYIFAIWKK